MLNWNPSDEVVKCLRAFQRHSSKTGIFFRVCRRLVIYRHRLWSVITASDIDLRANIGQGIRLPHPNGVVIHSDSVIGDHCMIMQQVTIGQLSVPGVPKIGSNVYIGAGAKVLGPITIGDGAVIGANAVVLCDVPSGYTAVGVPAVARPSKSRVGDGRY